MSTISPNRPLRIVANFLGALALLLGVWVYYRFQLQLPLLCAWRGGNPIYMLGQFGGVMTGNDFLHIYLGSRLLWHGLNPYDPQTLFSAAQQLLGRGPLPYVYLPFTAFIMRPISALNYGPAFLAWFLISHTCVLLAIPIGLRALRLRFSWWNLAFCFLLLGFCYPLWRNMSAGQLNAPLLLGYALFWLMLDSAPDSATGFLAAALMLFKLSPGILLIYLLWMRRWKLAGWMIGWALALMALTVALFGWRVHLDFLPLLRDMTYGRSTWAQFGQSFFSDPANQSFNALFHHLFATTGGANPATHAPLINLGPAFANALTYAVSLVLIALVFGLSRKNGQREAKDARGELIYSLFIFLSLLLPSLMWDHYLVQLFFPILIMLKALASRSSLPGSTQKMALGVLFLAGLLILCMPFNFFSDAWRQGPGLLMLSFKLWGTLLLFACNVMLLRWVKART